MTPLIFAHANSFPAGTYRLLLELLQARGLDGQALPRFGHDDRYPVTDNWPYLVQQLADFTAPWVARWGQPAYLVGHSMGGLISLMLAAQHPTLARGVVLLDAPLLGGWRRSTLQLAKKTPLVAKASPGAVSRKRRMHWPSAKAALAHFQHKKLFARWHPQVLQDYVAHAMAATPQGQWQLHFDREEETRIYNTVPHHLPQLLRRHPLRCPVAFIGGRHSREMRQVGMELTQRVTQGRCMQLEGGHLFPMEYPHATAAAIEACILNLGHAAHAAAPPSALVDFEGFSAGA